MCRLVHPDNFLYLPVKVFESRKFPIPCDCPPHHENNCSSNTLPSYSPVCTNPHPRFGYHCVLIDDCSVKDHTMKHKLMEEHERTENWIILIILIQSNVQTDCLEWLKLLYLYKTILLLHISRINHKFPDVDRIMKSTIVVHHGFHKFCQAAVRFVSGCKL